MTEEAPGFSVSGGQVGALRVYRMEALAGEAMRFRIAVPHANEANPAVHLFVSGRFVRAREEDGSGAVEYGPGETNDKLAFREPGSWLLRCVEPGLLFCVSVAGETSKPGRERIVVQGAYLLPRGSVAIVLEGAVGARIGRSFLADEWDAGRVLHAASGDVTLEGRAVLDRFFVVE